MRKVFVSIMVVVLCVCASLSRAYGKKTYDFNYYNTLVELAERLIVEGKIEKAHNLYVKCNKKNGRMFAVDLNNALICAVRLKDWKTAFYWSKRLIYKGIPQSYFCRPIFKEFIRTQYGKVLCVNFSKYRKTFLGTQNKTLLKALEKLQKKDQEKYCLLPQGEVTSKELFNMTESIDLLLTELFDEYGFPAEELVGVNYIEETKKINPLPKFVTLYRHSFQSNSRLLEPYLKEAIKNGFLKENQYSILIDNLTSCFVVINCKVYEVKQSNLEMENKRNVNRKKIIFSNDMENEDRLNYILYVPLDVFEELEIKSNKIDSVFKGSLRFVTNYLFCEG